MKQQSILGILIGICLLVTFLFAAATEPIAEPLPPEQWEPQEQFIIQFKYETQFGCRYDLYYDTPKHTTKVGYVHGECLEKEEYRVKVFP